MKPDYPIITIGERKIPLKFRMKQFIEAESEIGSMGNIEEKLNEATDRGKNLVALIRIMGNAGLKAAGEEADLTDDWLEEEMLPAYFTAYRIAVLAAVAWETHIENKTDDNEGERDLVLEEINKKKEQESSQEDTSSAGDSSPD